MIYISKIMRCDLPQHYQGDTVHINYGRWVEQVSKYMQQVNFWEVKELRLHDNERVNLLKDIGHIQFPNLTQLWVSGNRIQSIEALARVHIPHLRTLYLANNNISSIKAMRKAQWLSLKDLYTYHNYIYDQESLTEGHFPCLEVMAVYRNHLANADKNKVDNPWFGCKLQTSSLRYLCIKANTLIIDRSIRPVLSNKWKQAGID